MAWGRSSGEVRFTLRGDRIRPLSVDLLVRSLLRLGAKPKDIARAIA